MHLLIDGNAIGNAAQNTRKLHCGDREVQAIFEFIKMTRGYCDRFNSYKPIILWDGRAQWRYDLFPLYKANRDKVDPKAQAEKDAYREQKPDIQRAMKLLGVKQVTASLSEADDLAALMSKNATSRTILVTGDKDWLQLMSPSCKIFYTKSAVLCHGSDMLKRLTGFDTVDQFVESKCLAGDNSDNIPGVGGIGEKGVIEFLGRFHSVEDFFGLADLAGDKDISGFKSTLPKSWLMFANNEIPKASSKFGEMLPMRDAYYRNRKLMDLRSITKVYGDINIVAEAPDWEGFKEFCEELNFQSIVNNFEAFIAPFKQERL